jgi:hypothetical protein
MAADPGYLANLMALPTVERERLLGGNWKIRPAAGLYFQREWCEVVDAIPPKPWSRGWDLAATPKTESNDPDWTSGTKIGRTARWPLHRHRPPNHADRRRRWSSWSSSNTASADGRRSTIIIAARIRPRPASRRWRPTRGCSPATTSPPRLRRRQDHPLQPVLSPGPGRQRAGAARLHGTSAGSPTSKASRSGS